MRKSILSLVFISVFGGLSAQEYQFTDVYNLHATPVISQGRTGTCWSFSTSSFVESEIKRIKGLDIDISEMYNVRHTYPVKAENYLMRQGKAQFSEGGLAHDVMNSIAKNGLVPQAEYSGLHNNNDMHNHAEMVAVLTAMLDAYNSKPLGNLSKDWKDAINSVLDVYLGESPDEFTYNGKKYTPESFRKMTGIEADNYITITSFNHAPYNSYFILNIPDNFSNGRMYNVPLEEMMSILDGALASGFTVELDCDVSEAGFSARHGLAIVPAEGVDVKQALLAPATEVEVDQQLRQRLFENQETTDDHLMHITGMLKDQNGNKYYKVKNSWGDELAHGGYIYMSESYMKLKTISIMLHKDALPSSMKKKI